MKFINYTIVHFSILLASGITTAHFCPTERFIGLQIAVLLVAILFVLWFIYRRRVFQNLYFGLTAYVCLFTIGFCSYQMKLPKFQTAHYSHEFSANSPVRLQIKVREILKPDRYNNKYIANVQTLNGIKKTGKLLLSINKNDKQNELNVDDVLLVYTPIKHIREPLNPFQFNYKIYMKTLDVHHQVRISEKQLISKLNGTKTTRGLAEHLRTYLIKKLDKTALGLKERSIVKALVLGQKREIDPNLYKDYINAGAVHILAVSGLHVGILFLIFSNLFKPLKYIKWGNYIHSLFIIICLWGFALLTGLSASVTRAVTMFSFFAFTQIINRETSSINTLFLSFFVLLLINPLWLFHVGFQLSYMAVLSILLLQPRLYGLFKPKNYFSKLIWDILTVSIAAQVGILPFSLYYFQQFPGLFFITNIVVLPVLGIVLGGGLLIIILAAFDFLPNILVVTYGFLVHQLNSFISWVASQDRFIFEHIYFSETNVMCSYLLLSSLFLLWRQLNFQRLIFVLISFCLFTIANISHKYLTSNNELVIFYKNRANVIGIKQGHELSYYTSDTISNPEERYPLKGYVTRNLIRNTTEYSLPNILRFNQKCILIIDSLGIYSKKIRDPIVVLTHDPKLNLDRLIDSISPKIIIADGSNRISNVQLWSKSCEIKKLPFHHIGSKGALIIE